MFLHHFTAVLDDWDPRVIDPIAEQRHVITFDNRGIGGSGGKVPHTIAAMAADAAAFIRALGHDHVDLLGFSLGGVSRKRSPCSNPDLVRRLILTGTGHRGGGGLTKMPLIVGSAYTKAALTRLDPRQFLFFNRNAVGKQAGTEYIARLRERTADRDKPISHQARIAQLLAIRETGLGEPHDLSQITQPTFVANGDNDVMVASSQSHALAERIPNSKLEIYPELRARRHLPVSRAVRPRGPGVPRRRQPDPPSRRRQGQRRHHHQPLRALRRSPASNGAQPR